MSDQTKKTDKDGGSELGEQSKKPEIANKKAEKSPQKKQAEQQQSRGGFHFQYKFLNTLRETANGKVKRAIHIPSQKYVCIKVVEKRHMLSNEKLRTQLEKEIQVLKLLRHENIVHLFTVAQDHQYVYLVQELMEGGDLFDLVRIQHFNEGRAFNYFEQIMKGLEYCHSCMIAHRDLKLSNILMMKDQNWVKIADFGLASFIDPNKQHSTILGSPEYMAPEVLKASQFIGYDPFLADIWALGILLYVLVTGKYPFQSAFTNEVFSLIQSGKFEFPEDIELSSEIKDFIKKILQINPKKRMSFKQMESHAWFRYWSKKKSTKETKIEMMLDMSTPDESTPEEKKPSALVTDPSELDEDLIHLMLAMGWEKEKLLQNLHADTKNIDSVVYKLLGDQKRDEKTAKGQISFQVDPRNEVTLTHRLSDPVDPVTQLKKDIDQANKEFQQTTSQKKKGFFQKLFKKKTDSKETIFKLHSVHTEREIMAELTRAFKVLKIKLSPVNPTTIRAEFVSADEPVLLDVSVTKLPNSTSHIIEFQPVGENVFSATAVYHALKMELRV